MLISAFSKTGIDVQAMASQEFPERSTKLPIEDGVDQRIESRIDVTLTQKEIKQNVI